ncbi:MAG TPA: hypothetical protein VGH28_24770 [Polyangiaceae bacterium]
MTAIGFSIIGCSGGDGAPSASQIQSDLDTSFGGYTTAAEQPNFGDADMLAIPKFDVTFASNVSAAGSSTPTQSYRVALLWGHFPAANADSDADTDAQSAAWTGTVSVDQGAVDVVRTLSFDDGDSIAPRDDPRAVSFVSHTLPFVDGLLLDVGVTGQDPKPMLHFATNELTTDVDLDAVAASAGSVVHASGDQGLAVVGWNESNETCPGGVAYGRWVKMKAGVGTLRARILSAGGEDRGYAEGIWGRAPQRDAEVFFAKSINPAGAFDSLVEGTYTDGALQGTMGNDVTQTGSFLGLYSDGHDMSDGRGVFVAKWMGTCSPI